MKRFDTKSDRNSFYWRKDIIEADRTFAIRRMSCLFRQILYLLRTVSGHITIISHPLEVGERGHQNPMCFAPIVAFLAMMLIHLCQPAVKSRPSGGTANAADLFSQGGFFSNVGYLLYNTEQLNFATSRICFNRHASVRTFQALKTSHAVSLSISSTAL